jgi:DNA replicative helicase MCM subunit Mcm2 (Cdc46/Mcm family)
VSYQDKSITCRDCGHEFAFTASEQQFFAEKGFTNEPKRCPTCRRAKRASTSSIQGGQRTW